MQFQENVRLADHSNYKIGGPAKFFVEVKTVGDLTAALAEVRKRGERVFVLGGGNNLLISDAGFNGVVIKVAIGGVALIEKYQVSVGAGMMVADFLRFLEFNVMSGWEWAGGLPGTMGGAIWGNAGAFGGETKDSILSVQSVTLDGTLKTRPRAECDFDYRTSIFKQQEAKDMKGIKEIIVSAVIQLREGSREEIAQVVRQHQAHRAERHPLEFPNSGSIFKNVPLEKLPQPVLDKFREKLKNDPFPVLPTAVLTADAGLKGFRIGDAMISEKHSNFIVNMGGATAADVKAVMVHIKEVIKEKYNVDLEQEVIEVG